MVFGQEIKPIMSNKVGWFAGPTNLAEESSQVDGRFDKDS